MRNWRQLFVTYPATCALGAACAWSVASLNDGANLGALSPSAAAQDDPFGDDSDPFAEDAGEDVAEEVGDDTDPFGTDPDEEVVLDDEEEDADATDPFGASSDDEEEEADPFGAAPSTGPFAPTKDELNAPAPVAPESAASTALDYAAGKDAKYLRPEDVPNAEKTEQDFFATLTPAEAAILGQNPETAAEWLVAAIRVARVGRVEFAKILAQKSLDAPEGTPAECAAAVDSLGEGRLSYFVANEAIGEAGTQAVERVAELARRHWEDEATIRDAIARMNQGTPDERAAATLDVRKGGNAAIALLTKDLIDGDDERRRAAKSFLTFFKGEAVDALLAALRGADETALAPVVDALGEIADKRIAVELVVRYWRGIDDADVAAAFETALTAHWGSVPTRADAARLADEQADGYWKRTSLFPIVLDGETTVWRWDEATAAPVRETKPLDVAYRNAAAFWAQAACEVATDEENGAAPSAFATSKAVVATAERVLYEVGLDAGRDGIATFEAELPNLTVEQLVAALDYALSTNRFRGALIPVLLLQTRGDETLCYSNNFEPTAIVRAATCADRRVRFEAATAIVGWNPSRSYLGSSRVAATLAWFATASGERLAVVASPKLDETGRLGQLLAQQGFKTVPATSGRDLLLRAQASADVELIWATAAVRTPDLRVVAQTLRSDVRTNDVPLLVGYATDADGSAAGALVGAEPNATTAPTPFDLESGVWATQRLLETTKPEQVPVELRLAQSKAALRALLKLEATRPGALDDVVDWNGTISQTLATPALFDVGLEVAATLKTNFAQTKLVELIGDTRFDVATRRQALAALKRQWAANGSLLRGPEIVKMYDRYNASEKEDIETQKVLSEALDAFEAATAK